MFGGIVCRRHLDHVDRIGCRVGICSRVEQSLDGLDPVHRGREEIANRLKGIRNAAAETLGIDRGVLMSNTVILEIARIRPQSTEELARVPGVRRWQSETLAGRLLEVLSGSAIPGD